MDDPMRELSRFNVKIAKSDKERMTISLMGEVP